MPEYSSDRPANFYFGGGGDSFATPLAITVLVVAGILILTLPRKYAVVPFLVAGLLIPLNVAVVVATLHFNADRLLLLIGWIRLMARGERYPRQLTSIDKVVIYGAFVNSIDYVLVWGELGALINRIGFLCTALGIYFLLRSLIRTKEDVLQAIKVLAVVVALVAPAAWYEHNTKDNLFSVVGASELSSDFREGMVRASGPFAHAIIAGTFGVVLVPLFVGLWWCRRGRILAVIGIVSSGVMMLASSSSTPVMSLLAGVLALLMWRFRDKMRRVRYVTVALVVCLQVKMWITSQAPVWFAVDRVSGFLGGSGWHRAMLIDNFVRHFFEWCLIGTKNYADWGWSMWDVDNAFVGAGLMGGLVGFILFVAIFVYGYRTLGEARKAAEKSSADAPLICDSAWTIRTNLHEAEEARRNELLIWAIGSALFANMVAFFGIVYFDQSIIAWYALLVMIQVTPTFGVDEQEADREGKLIAAETREMGALPAWN